MPFLIFFPLVITAFPFGVVVAEAGGGGHGGGGPKSRVEIIRAVNGAEGRISSGCSHAALAFKTHEEKPSLS